MNKLELKDLEIRDGYLCYKWVRLTFIGDKYYETEYGTKRPISDMPDSIPVKSATIWTSIPFQTLNGEYYTLSYLGMKERTLEQLLQAISQDPEAYAENIVI